MYEIQVSVRHMLQNTPLYVSSVGKHARTGVKLLVFLKVIHSWFHLFMV